MEDEGELIRSSAGITGAAFVSRRSREGANLELETISHLSCRIVSVAERNQIIVHIFLGETLEADVTVVRRLVKQNAMSRTLCDVEVEQVIQPSPGVSSQ